MTRSVLPILLFVALAGAPGLAFAHPHPHPGSGGFGAGFAHPLLGLDHLLAMLGVGIWAAQQTYRRGFWLIPVAFLAAMLAGFGIGMGSAPLPLIEFGIVGSLAVVGLLVYFSRQLPLMAATAAAGVFAMFHGHAHGAETAVDLSGVAFALGFLLASAILLCTGVAVWRRAERVLLQRPVARTTGAALVLASAVFLVLLV